MSTKAEEPCPSCTVPTMPTDRAVAMADDYGTYPVKLWRYHCTACGWTWANELQRAHNQVEHRRARKEARMRAYS